jgi:hypothetical protein
LPVLPAPSISPLRRSLLGPPSRGAGGALVGSVSAAVMRSARSARSARGTGGGGGDAASASLSPRVVTPVSGPVAPPASSRYGLSPVSASALLDGRRPRPRRGGRRLSVMPLLGKKVNLVQSARALCGPLQVPISRCLSWRFPSAYARLVRSQSVRAMNAMYDGNKMRRDACSAVGTVGARIRHAIPTMLALRRGSRRLDLVARFVRDGRS